MLNNQEYEELGRRIDELQSSIHIIKEFKSFGYNQGLICGIENKEDIKGIDEICSMYEVYFNSKELPYNIVGMSDVMPYKSTTYREMDEEMVKFYEKAFKTKTDEIYMNEDNKVSHAVMSIHNQIIYLNDRFGAKERTTDISTNLIIVFDNTEEFMYSYEILKEGSKEIDPKSTRPYSSLVVQFIDKYNVQWAFMVKI